MDGKIAVAHVIMNRVQRRDATVKDIVRSPWQFSWLNPGAKRPTVDDFDALNDCLKAVYSCLSERVDGKDFFGADHYYADYIKEPTWVRKMKFVKQLGQHRFYRSQ